MLTFKRLFPFILTTTVLFIVSIYIGSVTPLHLSESTFEELRRIIKPLESFNAIALLFIIFVNNIIKALGAITFGILLGIPSIFFIITNGFIIGMVVEVMATTIAYEVIIVSLVPHGILEIPLLILSTSLGLSIGIESLKFLLKQNSSIKMQMTLNLRFYLKWIVTGLFLAALIEVFLTPWLVALIDGT